MKQLTAAIIGLGTVAPMHIKSLQSINIPIVAVCDKNANVAQTTKESLKNCESFICYNEMLEHGGFDVLHICLPHYLHAPVAIAALAKGFHVLCEKPMATTIADAENMISTARDSGKTLGVIFQNRYSPGAALIKEALDNGELGAVQGGWLRVTWNRPESYYQESDWRGSWSTEGGGVLINQSIHTFDMMNYFLGNPTTVSAAIANRAHPSIEVEDVAEGVITYGKTPISFFVNTYHPYDAPASMELICEHGRATLTGEDAEVILINGTKKTAGADIDAQRRFGMKSYWGVSHIKQITAFYNAVTMGQPPETNGYEGLRTQQLINGIYESAKIGKPQNLLT